MTEQIEIGRELYLFRIKNTNARRLVISAHAEYLSSQFSLRSFWDARLNFYTELGNTLVTTNDKFCLSELYTVLSNILQPIQQYKDFSEDYMLWKNQGKHQLITDGNNNILNSKQLNDLFEKSPFLNEDYDSIHRDLEKAYYDSQSYRNDIRDVLTIRNRFGQKKIKLSEVLQLLFSQGYYYNVIDCFFCREYYTGR